MQFDDNTPDGLQEKPDQNNEDETTNATNGDARESAPITGSVKVVACDIKMPAPAVQEAKQSSGDQSSDRDPMALRDELVDLAQAADMVLFVDAGKRSYASVPMDEHIENWELKSIDFSRWLRNLWRTETGCGIGSSVVSDAIATLDAMAAHEAKQFETHIRIAHHGGNIYVDLCNEQWQVIRITSSGWGVVDECPVKFLRTPGMLPMPMPVHNGALEYLQVLINAPTDEIWHLVLAWIIAAYSPGPYPILVLRGEQGTAKSFLSRTLRQLIDPSLVEVTTAPREARDVIIAANNSHVIALDNLSAVPAWLSDLLCGISTGTTYRERQYHSNNGSEVLFSAKKPIVINGIDFAIQHDFLDRSILLSLPVITPGRRMDERQIAGYLKQVTPDIVGEIFDVLVKVLENLPNTKSSDLPRMADFARWVTAGETALGWEPGYFVSLYKDNNKERVELALDSDSFAMAIKDRLPLDKGWEGNWKALLVKLSFAEDKPPRDWPATPQGVATKLKRMADALRQAGIEYTTDRTNDKRIYKFWRVRHAA